MKKLFLRISPQKDGEKIVMISLLFDDDFNILRGIQRRLKLDFLCYNLFKTMNDVQSAKTYYINIFRISD